MSIAQTDCEHEHWLVGTTVRRCTACGLSVARFESVAEAIAACRAALASAGPELGEPDGELHIEDEKR